MFSNKKAFTIIEITLVICIIWILIAWITVYLWGTDDRRAVIEAQGCASTIWGRINNYVFFALTSKNLKLENEWITVSPTIYTIQLSGWNSTDIKPCNAINASGDNILCDKLIFWFSTWWDLGLYKEITVRNSCRQNQPHLWFFWSGENNNTIKKVVMNKWFTTINLNNSNTFYLDGGSLVGDIIIALCNNDECYPRKEISKRVIDWRSQTISQYNCGFYDDEWFKCKDREN